MQCSTLIPGFRDGMRPTSPNEGCTCRAGLSGAGTVSPSQQGGGLLVTEGEDAVNYGPNVQVSPGSKGSGCAGEREHVLPPALPDQHPEALPPERPVPAAGRVRSPSCFLSDISNI